MAATPHSREFSPEYVRDIVRRARTNDELLVEAWPGLLRDHEGEWVVLDGDRMIFATSLTEATKKARECGLDTRVTVTTHIVKDVPAVLL